LDKDSKPEAKGQQQDLELRNVVQEVWSVKLESVMRLEQEERHKTAFSGTGRALSIATGGPSQGGVQRNLKSIEHRADEQ
jgi:hypothetical protein